MIAYKIGNVVPRFGLIKLRNCIYFYQNLAAHKLFLLVNRIETSNVLLLLMKTESA